MLVSRGGEEVPFDFSTGRRGRGWGGHESAGGSALYRSIKGGPRPISQRRQYLYEFARRDRVARRGRGRRHLSPPAVCQSSQRIRQPRRHPEVQAPERRRRQASPPAIATPTSNPSAYDSMMSPPYRGLGADAPSFQRGVGRKVTAPGGMGARPCLPVLSSPAAGPRRHNHEIWHAITTSSRHSSRGLPTSEVTSIASTRKPVK